jgi:hypothetical protein
VAYASNILVAVYQVLDQVIRANVPAPGAKAVIHSIIDDLYAASAPRQMIAQAESISVQLHHLEWAAARNDGGLASDARRNLRSIAAAWMERRINS